MLEKEIDTKIKALSDASDIENEKEPEDCEHGGSFQFLRCDSSRTGFL